MLNRIHQLSVARFRFPARLRTQLRTRVLQLTVLGWAMGIASVASAMQQPEIDYSRDIKPLLSDRCYQCHGPDGGSREAGFRLDDSASAFAEADSGLIPIVPGDPSESELFQRISLPADDIDAMPPKNAHKKAFSAEEISTVRLWIEQGAKFQKHWSFVAPSRPQVPSDDSGWSTNEIDCFVRNQMARNGLSPAEQANRIKLLRRVTFDLTGLPPTLEQLRAFQADQSDDAYEKVVDRLLASPQYGEHMARYWLDAVRYGDTHGLHLDNYREIWPYRDWVIRSFNENMDWSTFTTKQIAGDLLENATDQDRIASGYNRLHVSTNEGGSIKEEVYVRNVVDRVSTTSTVFLGMSVGCAQCHDHKFDPISMQDFYSMFAFFNNLDADPMDGNAKAHAPVLSIPTNESRSQLAELDQRRNQIQAQLDAPNPEFEAEFVKWQNRWREKIKSRWFPIHPSQVKSTGGSTLEISTDGQEITASGDNPAKDTYEIELTTSLTEMTGLKLDVLLGGNGRGGRASNGNAVLSEIKAEIRSANDDGNFQPLEFVSASADFSQETYPVKYAIDGVINGTNGWAIGGHQRVENSTAEFATSQPFGFEEGTVIRVKLIFESQFSQHSFQRIRLATTTDAEFGTHQTGSWKMAGPFIAKDRKTAFENDFGPESKMDATSPVKYTKPDGKEVEIAWTDQPGYTDGKTHLFGHQDLGSTYLYREIKSSGSRQIEVSLGSDDGIKLWLNGESILANNSARGVAADQEKATLTLKPGTNRLLLKIVNIGGATGFYYAETKSKSLEPDLATQSILHAAGSLTDDQKQTLREFYSQTSPILNKLNLELKSVDEQIAKVKAGQPTTLIMKERMEPKPAYLLTRGQYDQPDKEAGAVPRRVPSFLPPIPEGAPVNRLGFAQWLTAPENPLMSRVTVNRFWRQFMGAGIVSTADDFGSQGMPPSHPDLLDWLAVDFRESGWDIKRLVKSMVMSSAYRQDSAISPQALEQDPKNQWLARGPRYRLDAEMIRDQALLVSGLLHNKMGGPGVKPPQPLGLWKSVGYTSSNTANFKVDTGHDKVHRRSIYTFWKRTSPPPQMSVFDAPSREECTVSRERTNNPLQALLLLNDPQYFEAARHLAERVVRDEKAETVDKRLSGMFELATLRKPSELELSVLQGVFQDELKVYQQNAEAAKQLIAVGAYPPPTDIDLAELAALTLVANVVLNLDEIINKQ